MGETMRERERKRERERERENICGGAVALTWGEQVR